MAGNKTRDDLNFNADEIHFRNQIHWDERGSPFTFSSANEMRMSAWMWIISTPVSFKGNQGASVNDTSAGEKGCAVLQIWVSNSGMRLWLLLPHH